MAMALEETESVNWGPLVAVVGAVVIYFGGQFLGLAVLISLAQIANVSEAEAVRLNQSIYLQAFYVLLSGAFSLLILKKILVHVKSSFASLGLHRKPRAMDVALALGGYGVYFVLFVALVPIIKALVPSLDLEQPQQIGFEPERALLPLIVTFLSIVIIPAVVEELVARGFLYSGLRKRLPIYLAAIITSVLFALPHLQFETGQPLLWIAALDTFVLSLVLIGLRESTGSLWASIALHFIKNSVAFVAVFLIGS